MTVSRLDRAKLATGVVAALLSGMGIANAGCSQTDLVGNWQTYSVTEDSSGGGWIRCAISISATITNNVKLAVGGVCRGDLGQNFVISQIGSRITVSPTCAVSGMIKTSTATLTLTQGTMSLDQIRFSGVGNYSIGGGIFVMNAEKY